MKLNKTCFVGLLLSLSAFSCGNKNPESDMQTQNNAYTQISPDFNPDSAYYYIDKQVAFGPRVPNTQEHTACGDYLVNELKRFGADVTEQRADLKAYDGTILKSRNIIGSFNNEKTERILLFAHWDTRPFADRDPNPENYRKAILGANDGASGVGVLLEIARQLHKQSTEVGIDIIFFDAEDYGEPSFDNSFSYENYWCLGSQYWAKTPHVPGYKAKYGILLDMVGAANATFHKEYISKQYAGGVLEKVWTTARNLGYGRYFVDKDGGMITDDHLPVNQVRQVPSINIIQYEKDSETGFGWYWHTLQDNMDNISKETLKAVGQTVMEVIYKEK